ncbi:diguanylate cyclase [bacterium]|nr:diguanylate cyclase [bacterium]MBU1989916.1 diguanylate cyclase [bacterium]
MRRKGFLLLAVFLILSAAIVYVGDRYKNSKVDEYVYKQYSFLANSINSEVESLIEEKKNAILSLAISLAQSNVLDDILKEGRESASFLKKISQSLRETTDFKNVWIQIINKKGISYSRSWTPQNGDNLALIRKDVASMIQSPSIKSIISVGKFDMTFKAMVPIFDQNNDFIGIIEVITHFNSIAKKVKSKSFEPVVLVDKKYKEQIIYPFTNTFAGDYYIANKGADKKLVEHINKKGLKYFTSPSLNYVVDDEQGCLVVNYTLFDTDKKPMANFLMFKSLQDIDFSSIDTIKANINLFIVLAIFIIGFMLYLLWDKEKADIEMHVEKKIMIFIALFLVVCSIYFLVLTWYFDYKKYDFIKNYNNNIQKDYTIISRNLSKLADSIFKVVIDKPEVLGIMAMAHRGDEQKNSAREKLFHLLIGEYEYFKGYDLRQLHFQLKNNESFLRFHRPQKYGDNLTGVRETIEWVNTNLTKIEGFEEGRIFNGFRHVFPLSRPTEKKDKEHVGSVEISFSAYALLEEFTKSHNAKAGFMIAADVVSEKVFSSEKSNYEQSDFEGFLYEKSIKSQLEHGFSHIDVSMLDKSDIQRAAKEIYKGEVFSIPSKDNYALFTFVPFKNPISKKVVSVAIVQEGNMELNNQQNQYFILLLAGIGSILFGFLYVYKEFSSKHQFLELSKKTQKILDAQESIVIITNGKMIIDANKKFLDFFGFSSLEDFKQVHNCICEYFEENDKFFHLGKVPEGEIWIETLLKLSNKEYIVSMKDINGKSHSFAILVNNFEENYILSFSDISDTISAHFSLENKATHDNLTNAFNREYFESIISDLIEESYKKDLKLGMILFDIDHFKNVNDSYGHNVGDLVLKHLVKTIHTTIRAEDILIRWGGEEFILLIRTQSLPNLLKLCEHIKEAVENERFEKIGQITCSFGVTIHKFGESIEETVRRADSGLYEAKNNGRNLIVVK